MSGNVWEHTWDLYAAPYDSADTVDPIGPSSGEKRTYRGGSWDTPYSGIRVSHRGYSPVRPMTKDIGIRLVRTLDPDPATPAPTGRP